MRFEKKFENEKDIPVQKRDITGEENRQNKDPQLALCLLSRIMRETLWLIQNE